jgi:hypothetical protein
MNDYSIEDRYHSECEHKEWYTDDEIMPQMICVKCGCPGSFNPFQNTTASHSKSKNYTGFWSEDFQFISEDCT